MSTQAEIAINNRLVAIETAVQGLSDNINTGQTSQKINTVESSMQEMANRVGMVIAKLDQEAKQRENDINLDSSMVVVGDSSAPGSILSFKCGAVAGARGWTMHPP